MVFTMKAPSRVAPQQLDNTDLVARPIRQWEYLSALFPRSADITSYGLDGWECYAVIGAAADAAMFYFRRQK
jgi:hypothetical protein